MVTDRQVTDSYQTLKKKYSSNNIMEINEFEIPVPWGHVAVKTWGNEQNPPVFAIHGLADNAGSFYRLLPYLPTSFYYICIDLPSHGKSSPYPPHIFISVLNNVLTLKIVLDYFDRKKYILMGHGWGGQTAVLFTQLYPQCVLKLIIFDAFYLLPQPIVRFKKVLREKFENLIKISEKVAKNHPPSYTYDEAITKLIDNRFYGELSRESAETLVTRSLIPVGGGKFRFSTDPRLKYFVNLLCDMRYITDLLKKYPMTCPALFITASESTLQLQYFKEVVQELKGNEHCVIKEVTGCHEVHNNSPEIVGPIANSFLMNGKCKL